MPTSRARNRLATPRLATTSGLTFTKTCVVYCHTNWYRFK
jgi:hypothetical protein